MHLTLRTGYSFKKCFLKMEDIHKYVENGYVGIADENNTYGHVFLQRQAEEHGFRPVFGVRLGVVARDSKKRSSGLWHVFIATNNQGLRNLYRLVETAWDQFYYTPRLYPDQVDQPFVIHLNPLELEKYDDNQYGMAEDKTVYQLMAGTRKHGEGYRYLFDDRCDPGHILSDFARGVTEEDRARMLDIAHQCIAKIPEADMVTRPEGASIINSALEGAERKGIDLDDPIYQERFEREMDLIHNRKFVDYFMIVSEMCKFAKKQMLVGPSRGSSAGSLVCYLLDITEVDPIEHGLVFERFIDINRHDLPDIDIDFPDVARSKVVDYLKHTYGRDHVASLANIVTFKPKYAINEFCKSLDIPAWESADLREAIIFRSGGDARAKMQIEDTLYETDVGKAFMEKHPEMDPVKHIEGHPSHSGKHAAGILVSTKPLSEYGAFDPRNDVLMLEKKGAEYIGLLKIDVLGLSTLSVIQECCELVGIDWHELYSIPLDDEKTYDLFNDQRLTGVFQFEGDALRNIVRQMKVRNFHDISAITALARPGALNSGGTAQYIGYANGRSEPVYYSDRHRSITRDTLGIVVYQEQMMKIAREIGGMTWEDVSDLRKASSKSKGVEFFNQYKEKFVKGAKENGYSDTDIDAIWNDISHSGSWSFNKSHAVSYAMVSYWTAYLKCHHHLEYSVAYLNNADDENGIKFLRDMVKYERLSYVPVDPDLSTERWSTDGSRVIGGLQNIKGIGPANARAIIKARTGDGKVTPSVFKKLMNPVTPFDVIFPAEHYFGDVYSKPLELGLPRAPDLIENVNGAGDYYILGVLRLKNIRDLNETYFLEKRGGQVETEQVKYLNFKLEDDTDQINVQVTRDKYEQFGREIGEVGRVGQDWYLVKGTIKRDEYRRLEVTYIWHLNKLFGVDP